MLRTMEKEDLYRMGTSSHAGMSCDSKPRALSSPSYSSCKLCKVCQSDRMITIFLQLQSSK